MHNTQYMHVRVVYLHESVADGRWQVRWDDEVSRAETKVVWCARAACDQRAGRTGRTGPGEVFRLVPRAAYPELLAPFEPAQLMLSG